MPNQKVMVCTRPMYETATWYGSCWLGLALDLLRVSGLSVTDLYENHATLNELLSSLNQIDPASFWGFGHGSENYFLGQNGEILLEKGVNEYIMEGRIVHLTACLCGVDGGLSEALAEAGAVASIGYSSDFILGLATPNFPDSPDNAATESLLKPDIYIELSMAKGKTIVDAMLLADDISDQEIEYWRGSGYEDADLLIFSHINNRDAKTLYGVPFVTTVSEAQPISVLSVVVIWASVLLASLGVIKSWR